ncbi:MAG TPA: hypothetical protein VMW45_00720 [Dehalococcoidia bacterium]|nr:hypothetical protein [Dehalococcoidia bacterium]
MSIFWKVCAGIGFIMIVAGIYTWTQKIAILVESWILDLIGLGIIAIGFGIWSLLQKRKRQKSQSTTT